MQAKNSDMTYSAAINDDLVQALTLSTEDLRKAANQLAGFTPLTDDGEFGESPDADWCEAAAVRCETIAQCEVLPAAPHSHARMRLRIALRWAAEDLDQVAERFAVIVPYGINKVRFAEKAERARIASES